MEVQILNCRKRKIDFEHSIDEDRCIAIGKVGDVLFVVFTERKEVIRLARLATEAERGLYYDQNIYYTLKEYLNCTIIQTIL